MVRRRCSYKPPPKDSYICRPKSSHWLLTICQNIEHCLGRLVAWVLGRNISWPCNTAHIGCHAIQLQLPEPSYISMLDFNRNSHVSIDRIIPMFASPSPPAVGTKGQEAANFVTSSTAVDTTSSQVSALAPVFQATAS